MALCCPGTSVTLLRSRLTEENEGGPEGTREGMTQIRLSELTGIPQRRLPTMERGKRFIGEKNVRVLDKEEVAGVMGTTKSAISRLEATGKHAPSLATLKKYAQAVGCCLEIKLVPKVRKKSRRG